MNNNITKPGSKGKDVEQVQALLKQLGFDVTVDGAYGPATEQAVRVVQAKTGLAVDGIAGPDTLRKIGEKIAENAIAAAMPTQPK